MDINDYIKTLESRYKQGISSEHSYRADLESLISNYSKNIQITNEPKKVTDCGNPDFVLTRDDLPIGFIEAKDIGKNLNSSSYNEQFTRYRESLDNLIITDYTRFLYYKNNELIDDIQICTISGSAIKPLKSNFDKFINLISDFTQFTGKTIKSPKLLAELMAKKARLLQTILERALLVDENRNADSELFSQYQSFKNVLIHDLGIRSFSDIYAQTLAYGMFAARLHDPTLETFSRFEAAQLIPKSNPFLRRLFQSIGGYELDRRIQITVDNLAQLFRYSDVKSILMDFSKSKGKKDPIIHFYETFLEQYDYGLRYDRGVWYTPEPIVKFIVKSVDYILKDKFKLVKGLADNSKTKILEEKAVIKGKGLKKGTRLVQQEKEIHKLQILDPATGTGTFLSEIIKYIFQNYFSKMQGAWPNYVNEHLIPRLNGFELLMASYSMAHLKLDLLLNQTGIENLTDNNRYNIYLTNSLEEYHPETGTIFASWLSQEASAANYLKKDTPVMVVIGNPPYKGVSSNNNPWISELIENYKYVKGEHFKETKHWLNDDYVKFIRFSQYHIEKTGEGIIAFINAHTFLDNPTFRGMRWNLLNTFDEIYCIDLHGNYITENYDKDENVFGIKQGVSINFFIKKANTKKESNRLARVYYFDLVGSKESKFEFLDQTHLKDIQFSEINLREPYYFFSPKEFNSKSYSTYLEGFNLSDLFLNQSMGITSARDHLVVDIDFNTLTQRIEDFISLEYSDDEIREKYFGNKKEGKYKKGDTRGWKLEVERPIIRDLEHDQQIKKVSFRPFDDRYMYYTPHLVDWDRLKIMKHMFHENVALCLVKRGRDIDAHNYFLTNNITDKSIISSKDNANIFPLFIYDLEDDKFVKKSNLNMEVISKIQEKLKLKYSLDKVNSEDSFSSYDLLDYIYAILYSINYREEYKEELKIDFPRVPFPNPNNFWVYVKFGRELRLLHTNPDRAEITIDIDFPVAGENLVEYVKEKNISESSLKIKINESQYFSNIPTKIWNYKFGGYYPCKKWLKDRIGRKLNFDDIYHFQKIVNILDQTENTIENIYEYEINL